MANRGQSPVNIQTTPSIFEDHPTDSKGSKWAISPYHVDYQHFIEYGISIAKTTALTKSNSMMTFILISAGLLCFALFFKSVDYFEKI